MRVDVVVFGGNGRAKDSDNAHGHFANRKSLARLSAVDAERRLTHNCRIGPGIEFAPVPGQQLQIARRSQLLRRHAVEDDHVEARAAVVRKDLDRHHILHARQLGGCAGVVLGQLAAGRTKAILLKHDQRAQCLLIFGEPRQVLAARSRRSRRRTVPRPSR